MRSGNVDDLMMLGERRCQEGKPHAGFRHFDRALHVAIERGDQELQYQLLFRIGWAHLLLRGEPRSAAGCWRSAAWTAATAGHPAEAAWLASSAATLFEDEGMQEKAGECARLAAGWFRDAGEVGGETLVRQRFLVAKSVVPEPAGLDGGE